ncbi:MAG: hypothetical protein A3F70_01255 [Acidobacteria bacterium RIFCSPLOWO2_12_FULL_67_14]|nr:MAG: hypothetical protein A3F70_01255 [Acidobacteria bacterium RIFCSPLOWO2_12_FULL_67_14]
MIPAKNSTSSKIGMSTIISSSSSPRALFNYFGDRISDVGANQAPDILEEGRGSFDLVLAQRIRSLGVRLTFENLTDSEYLITQVGADDPQRLFKLGRTIALSFSFNAF